MDAKAWRDAADLFGALEDPRVVGRCQHRLTDIVMITLVALIGPCEDWEDIAAFGKANEGWPRSTSASRSFAMICSDE